MPMRASLTAPVRSVCLAGLLALSLLSACAQLSLGRAETGPRQTHAAPAMSAALLQLNGRLSVLSPHRESGRLQGSQAHFELRGNAEQGQLELSTPMGSLIARAQWQPGIVTVQTSEGERAYEHLDAMAADLLGEAVPMAALFDWLQARPWPGAEHQALAAPLSGFQQLGWHVDLARSSDGLIVARSLKPPEVTLRVRIDRPDPASP